MQEGKRDKPVVEETFFLPDSSYTLRPTETSRRFSQRWHMRADSILGRLRICLVIAGGLTAAGWGWPEQTARADSAGSCGRFGTAVTFVDSPSEAARRALKEEKLVFVLHVSGLFED